MKRVIRYVEGMIFEKQARGWHHEITKHHGIHLIQNFMTGRWQAFEYRFDKKGSFIEGTKKCETLAEAEGKTMAEAMRNLLMAQLEKEVI